MKLLVFKTFWGHTGSLEQGIAIARAAGFDGIEAAPPATASERTEWRKILAGEGIAFISEITTGCAPKVYVPTPGLSVSQHRDDFLRKLEHAMEMAPLSVNCMAGSDLWEPDENLTLLGGCIESARTAGLALTFEMHRSRATFHPIATRRLLEALPELRLNCDFSHWCCVCEQLVMDALPELLALCADRADHFHARVGYEQGPQVPHPGAPESAAALDAHLRWWREIWKFRHTRGETFCTVTPEFGPDGYLHTLPFTDQPVADLWSLNTWIADRLRQEFAIFTAECETSKLGENSI